MRRAFRPVVPPAHDNVTPINRVPVISERPALELELNPDPLPFAWANLALGFAVRETLLDRFDEVAEFVSHHPEEEDDALFIDRLVAKTAKPQGIPVGGPVIKAGMPVCHSGVGVDRYKGRLCLPSNRCRQ
jgi:hypothetical protein